MTSKFIILSVTAFMLFGAGCSKNRGWLSRNDYSEMQDPFMEPGTAVAKSSSRKTDAKGRASLDASDPSPTAAGTAMPGSGLAAAEMEGPKPIRRAGASSDLAESGRRVSAASYPEDVVEDGPRANGTGIQTTAGVKSYSGPALSDFLQKRKASARDATIPASADVDQLPTRTASAVNTAAQNSLSPAATRSSLPEISPEAENFSNFLSDKSRSTADASRMVGQQPKETTTDTSDFVSWAEQEKATNRKAANTVKSAGSNDPAPLQDTGASAFQRARQATREIADPTAAPDFDDAVEEMARPLLNRPGVVSSPPALSQAKAPSPNAFSPSEDPFADSFEDSPASDSTPGGSTSEKPTAKSATTQADSTSDSLDDSFRMDTGWKPAHVTRP